MKKRIHSKEELEILRSIETEPEKWKSVSDKEKRNYIEAAKAYVKNKKEKRITIRINEDDLNGIQKLANEEGLPYQTFITSLLHKIAKKRLIDRELFDELLSKLKAA